MKQNKFFLGLATIAAALTFASCSSEEPEIQTQSKEDGGIISLTSSISKTRTTSDPQATALNTSNAVGVFVTSTADGFSGYNNIQHSVATGGGLSSSTTMNYPTADGATVNIYAYAPYNEEWSTQGNQNFSVSTDQTSDAGYLASDLLWASKSGQASSTEAVSLTFYHKMSLLNITINNDAESGVDLTNAQVLITGAQISTTFNTSDGTVGSATGDATPIKAVSALGTGTKACAVIVPQTIGAGTELIRIITPNKILIAKIGDGGQAFASSNQYNYTVTIPAGTTPSPTPDPDPTPTEVQLTLTSVIEGWIENNISAIQASTPSVTSPLLANTFGESWVNSTHSASWDSSTNTYTWTATNSNLMTVFTFSNGDLACYKHMHINLESQTGGKVRLNFLFSDDTSWDKTFYSTGEKNMDLTDTSSNGFPLNDHSLADVTAIRFGGKSFDDGVTEATAVVNPTSLYLTIE